jgi:hypothetical protein
MCNKKFLWLTCLLFVISGHDKISAEISTQLRNYVYVASDVKNNFQASSILNVYNDKNSGTYISNYSSIPLLI